MGKGRRSRKGKKEWRKNISSSELEEVVERAAREERIGGPLDAQSNESLFFVDKSGDESLKRKVDKHRNKVLHCDSVLQRSSLVPALPSSKKRKLKDRDVAKRPQKPKPVQLKTAGQKKTSDAVDLWEDDGKAKESKKKVRKLLPDVPAVEVDIPGCSYNPTFDDHQEALGAAVAQEMREVYQKALQPEPIPLQVCASLVDEEDEFFLDVDGSEGEEEAEPEAGTSRAVKVKKLTRADLNKRARRQESLRQEAEVQKKRKLKQEIERLPEIKKTIQVEEEERKNLWIRRMTAKKERQASGPPRLGKHKFKPDSVKVLLSEEVTGSLRKLKGCHLLLKERFKSLQRRGIIEPRVPAKKKAGKMWVNYEPGNKGAKERQMHAEREARKQALAVLPL